VRVWLEDDDTFRARLTALAPADGPPAVEPVATGSSPGDVLTAVHAWLVTFLHDTPKDDGG
jgi:hypothetical protein